MTTLEGLATQFGNTESPEEALPIIEEADKLFLDVMLWQGPECVQELQINVALAVENLSSAMKAIMDGDVEEFNRNYGTYAIAVDMANKEYQRLVELVGD